ncbi:MAG: PhzF family phenazine biosynthesis protein [Paracoccaceae bacterium]
MGTADLIFHTLDVFTDQAFSGNPLAVVLGADGLSAAQMQTIAREFNLSETIFVQAPRDPANSARVRIFFPTAEIPFAGHPTIGCAILLSGLLDDGAANCAELTLEEEAGLVPVCVSRDGNAVTAEFTAPVLPFAAPGGASDDDVAQALGLAPAEIGCSGHGAPAHWQGGPSYLYVPVADAGALARARPTEPQWSCVMAAWGADGAWLYTPDGAAGYRARMFSPSAGIPEDPATGSAAAIFAAELLCAGRLGEGENRVSITQGVEMGRPSQIALRIELQDGALTAVHIRGSAVPVSSGRIRAPDA